MVVVAIMGVLSALIMPALGRARNGARSAACVSNLRQLQTAYVMYLEDHGGHSFPYRESLPQGQTLWYWGLESGGGSEGSRALDKSQARLAPYLSQIGGVEICPALAYSASYFKRKFDIASYGYGLNAYLLAGLPQNPAQVSCSFDQIDRPSETIAWGDAIQVNTWQAPASPQKPMLEEWYYLDISTPAKFHFRHNRRFNAVMADSSVRSFQPARLDPRCDGLSGYIEASGKDYYLRLVK
jgi:prepilin-type processing-associated H-X9-DG protein